MALALLLTLMAPATGRSAPEGLVSAEHPAEYMIYQYPGTTLVLRIDVPEAEFSERTIGPESALVRSSSVPGRRLGPVYQVIDAVDLPRQLMIEVVPGRAVERAAISLEVLKFDAGDRNVAAVRRAYQLFSLGTETAFSNDKSSWASKSYSLKNAAAIFASLGMEEMRLWSEYFSAHLVLHQLDDPVMALEWIADVVSSAARAGFEQVELASRVLAADAILRLAASSSERVARSHYDKAHEALTEVAVLAQRMGLEVERGRALFQDGRVYELQGEFERALDRYREAMDITARTNDSDLLNEVRAVAATLYESLGSTSGALEMLGDIAETLQAAPEAGSDLELAARLFEKGRLLNGTYRYPDAAGELSRALQLQQASASRPPWGLTGLELAWSRYSLGDMDGALALLEQSLPRMQAQDSPEDVARAYGSLANIYRERGQFEAAARARESQRGLVGNGPGKAAALIEAAIDAALRDGFNSVQVRDLLRRGMESAEQAGDRLSAARAGVYLCLAAWKRGQGGDCDEPGARASFEALHNSGVPRVAAEASLAWSGVLRLSGRAREAVSLLGGLMDELQWYRRSLPGVLGAWYAENRDDVVREYLSLVRGGLPDSEGADGGPLLMALERVRVLEAADFARPVSHAPEQDGQQRLRELLAKRETSAGDDARRLAEDVNRSLAAARATAVGAGSGISAGELDRFLSGLGRNEGVLCYYFAGERSLALLADRDGVRAVGLPGAESVERRLEELRDSLAPPQAAALRRQLEALGQLLLKPLARALPERIYLLPTGPLRGVPFDALRVGGKYVAQEHRVVNLASLPSIQHRSPRLPAAWRERVFLAGNPQQQGDPFSLEFRASPEIAAVTDRFVGPGLHIVQGVALQKDEFTDERFNRAGLIHMAMPGTIDLAFPDRSRLQLAAGAAGGAGSAAAAIVPAEIRAFELGAELVVLSGTAVVGRGLSAADSRLGFVSDFIEAGAGAVLASIWPAGEESNAEFASELYDRLRSAPDLEHALSETRRSRMGRDGETNLSTWAGFQLFIR